MVGCRVAEPRFNTWIARPDSSFLADLVDGVLLVVRAGSTPSATAQRSCQELQGRTVVGVVLNARIDELEEEARSLNHVTHEVEGRLDGAIAEIRAALGR